MKKLIVLLVLSSFFLVSCGETQQNNDGEEVDTGVNDTIGTSVDYMDGDLTIGCEEGEQCEPTGELMGY